MWTIRDASADDVLTLLTVIRAAFEEYRGRLDPPSGGHDETLESVKTKLAGAHALVAFAGPVATGCVLYEVGPEAVYFSRLSVLAEFRRRGLGRALIEQVEARARSANRSRVRLGVRVALDRQRSYYERLGYRFVEARAHAGHVQPTYVILEKALDESPAGPPQPPAAAGG